MKNKVAKSLNEVLAKSYGLYLKTQNYHWNIEGSNFYALHLMLEEQYKDHAEAIDVIAERVRALGEKTEANFTYFDKKDGISEPDKNKNAKDMLLDLVKSHEVVIKAFEDLSNLAADEGDKSTEDLAIGRISEHQKQKWMLKSSAK